MIEPAPLQQVGRTHVLVHGRQFTYFSGCDYYRLASHPAVLGAIQQGIECYGLNVAASRLTTGNHPLYRRLERALARHFGAADAVLIPAGYTTNLAVTQALAGQFTLALLDQEAHMCLADASRFLGCPIQRFKHCDLRDVARLVNRAGKGARVLLLTDGMFARHGTAAPLKAYLKVLPSDALLLVDDAHGAGVLGRTGRGTLEWNNVSRARVIQTLTLSKAFGVYGGAVLCSRAQRRAIVARSHLFVGSTPLPLPLTYAALTALRLHRSGAPMRRRLRENANRVKSALQQAGIELPAAPGPIVTIQPRTARQERDLRRQLSAEGIYPCLTKYPGGPSRGHYRFVISSEHSSDQLDALVAAVCRGLKQPLPSLASFGNGTFGNSI